MEEEIIKNNLNFWKTIFLSSSVEDIQDNIRWELAKLMEYFLEENNNEI